MKKTPEPWEIAEGPADKLADRGFSRPPAIKAGNDYVAVLGVGSVSFPNAEANACLIAAAPETAAERDRLKQRNAELVKGLNKIGYELLGHVEASHREVLDMCVETARTTLGPRTG